MTLEPLPRDFYAPTADVVAPQLLGHFLLRRIGNEWLGGEIVETEAYLVNDPACHAYVRETPRNAMMWGENGFAYVFRIYGSYFCVNAVTRPRGFAEAVLIRAIEPRLNPQKMKQLREVKKEIELSNGPSKLCLALGISGAQNGLDLVSPDSDLIIARNQERLHFLQNRGEIIRTSRIGLSRAADWPLRWYLGGSKSVSKRGIAHLGPWEMPVSPL
ncbi:DNA-3-methyladenine glycosylase [Abditibacterium utsteinense]|uniref:Putative 3-methyladenine DNA glycosylase n=1 Tax=Abditibacterium utsteinense TaxID=1960156 RepID=A0A2S8SQB0_9BACT|nr:DNA-3-methyladenine glycosylase [Abditibacterium utsteinense]PQV62991.1 DNA-3-methyladenine glycosylase [Abditibacterium utsteinense]